MANNLLQAIIDQLISERNIDGTTSTSAHRNALKESAEKEEKESLLAKLLRNPELLDIGLIQRKKPERVYTVTPPRG